MVAAGLQAIRPAPVIAAPQPSCPDMAADATTARATARQCGKQVEIASARTESSQIFAQPGGGYQYVATAAPTRVHRPDGTWVAADPTLVRRPDGSISPVATTVDLSFSGGGTGPFVTAGTRGKGLALSWHGALPAPTLNGSTATYAEILPGVDLQVIARVDGFSENVIVKNAAAARNPALRSLVFSTKTTGLSLSTAEDGSGALVAKDAKGRSVFQAAPPRMWAETTVPSDSGTRAPHQREFGEPTQRGVGLRVGAGTLTVIPDASLLAGSSFPITIDPTFTGDSTQGMTWAQVYQTFPSSSHYMDTDSEGLRVGHAQADSTDNYTPYTNRSFWSFPTPVGMDGSTVSSATFYATERYAWTCTKMHVDLWDTSPISSSTTWNNQPVFYQPLDQNVTTGYGYSPGGCPNATEVHWDATIGAAADASGNWHQLTLGLRVPNENQENPSNWHKYIATSGKLIIAYNSAPVTPTANDLSVNRAGQVYPCASGPAAPLINTTGGLTLQATLSDPDGDPVTAHWTVNNVALADDPSLPSGTTQIKTLPAEMFGGTGTVTTWQVSASDGSSLPPSVGPVCQIIAANDGLGPPSLSSTDLKLVQDPQVPPTPPSTAVVGVPGTVTLVPPAGAAIVGYKYGVGNSQVSPISYIPAAADGTAKLAVVPQVSGLAKNYLSFQAVDSAGNTSLPVRYVFKALAGTTPHVLGDATGDGKGDVTIMSNVGGGNSMLWRWDATSSGLSAPMLVQDPSAVYPNASTLTVQGDFDGDGLSDVAVFTQSGTSVLLTVQRSDRNLLLGSQTLLTIPYWYLPNMKLAAGDFTGDGKADIEVKYNIGNAATQDVVIVNTSTVGSPSFAAPAIWATNCSGCDDWNRAKIVAGDFTGDGKADVAEFYDYGSGETKIWMLDSNGTAFVSGGMVWDSGQHWWTWSSSVFFVGDFNGDGKLDIGAQYADPYAYAVSYWVFTQTATGNFNWPAAWTAYGQSWNLSYGETEPVPGDFDGDGKTDLALVVHCCGLDQTRLWTLASTGSSFAAPVYRGAGALGLSSVGSINPIPGTHYQIVAVSSGKCLEVPGGATGNAVYLDQRTCASGVAYQQFTVTPVSGGYVWIQPAHVTGKCLQVASASTADGAQIGQFDCASFTPSMMFQLSYVGGNGNGTTMQIKPLHTLMCGNLNNNGLGDGALFYQAACSSATSEQYILQLAS